MQSKVYRRNQHHKESVVPKQGRSFGQQIRSSPTPPALRKTQRALDNRIPSVPRTRIGSRGRQTLTEKRSNPKDIVRVLEGLEHEYTQERNVNEREDERQTKGVDQGIVLWLSNSLGIEGSHDYNEGTRGVEGG